MPNYKVGEINGNDAKSYVYDSFLSSLLKVHSSVGSRGSNPRAPQLDTFLFLLLVNKKTNSKYFIHLIKD